MAEKAVTNKDTVIKGMIVLLGVMAFVTAYSLGQKAETRNQKNMNSRLEAVKKRFTACQQETVALKGGVENTLRVALELAADERHALQTENELLTEDNEILRDENNMLDEQIDELRDFLDEKDWVSDEAVAQLNDAIALGNNTAELTELFDNFDYTRVSKDELIQQLVDEISTKRAALKHCRARKKKVDANKKEKKASNNATGSTKPKTTKKEPKEKREIKEKKEKQIGGEQEERVKPQRKGAGKKREDKKVKDVQGDDVPIRKPLQGLDASQKQRLEKKEKREENLKRREGLVNKKLEQAKDKVATLKGKRSGQGKTAGAKQGVQAQQPAKEDEENGVEKKEDTQKGKKTGKQGKQAGKQTGKQGKQIGKGPGKGKKQGGNKEDVKKLAKATKRKLEEANDGAQQAEQGKSEEMPKKGKGKKQKAPQ
eukprot:TRINITY_DN47664_c0_g1_i1.p1 TRINITY_DN47664_c0_g1~~TRINITY_DN47664_c0_g1_i1.p1  ORF type:complete len:428 (+),score=100.17 TRINITY_DN47664_c0_g1_i1:61-1344(+)